MLITSNFRNATLYPGEYYSVALTQPHSLNYKTIQVRQLAPAPSLLKKIKEGMITFEQYTTQYNKILDQERELLSRLMEAVKERTIVLLCWEKEGDNCHRRLIVDYLINNMGLDPALVEVH